MFQGKFFSVYRGQFFPTFSSVALIENSIDFFFLTNRLQDTNDKNTTNKIISAFFFCSFAQLVFLIFKAFKTQCLASHCAGDICNPLKYKTQKPNT